MDLLASLRFSPQELDLRRRFIGGSEANILMGGDKDRIRQLWRVKRGEADDEDLSDILAVVMGSFTEPLHRAWFEKQTGRQVTDHQLVLVSNERPFMRASLDGLTDDGETVWEAKHKGASMYLPECLREYKPQLTHNMLVSGRDRACLSVIFGNYRWACQTVELDYLYAADLVAVEAAFWESVQTGKEP